MVIVAIAEYLASVALVARVAIRVSLVLLVIAASVGQVDTQAIQALVVIVDTLVPVYLAILARDYQAIPATLAHQEFQAILATLVLVATAASRANLGIQASPDFQDIPATLEYRGIVGTVDQEFRDTLATLGQGYQGTLASQEFLAIQDSQVYPVILDIVDYQAIVDSVEFLGIQARVAIVDSVAQAYLAIAATVARVFRAIVATQANQDTRDIQVSVAIAAIQVFLAIQGSLELVGIVVIRASPVTQDIQELADSLEHLEI